MTVSDRRDPPLSTFCSRLVLTEVLTEQSGGTRYPSYDLLESPAVHRHRQGSAHRRHGGGLGSSNASSETIAGEKLDIVEVRD